MFGKILVCTVYLKDLSMIMFPQPVMPTSIMITFRTIIMIITIVIKTVTMIMMIAIMIIDSCGNSRNKR